LIRTPSLGANELLARPPRRGALGKVLLGGALETKQPKGFGRVRFRALPVGPQP